MIFLNFCLYFYLGINAIVTIIPKSIIRLFKKDDNKIVIKTKKLFIDKIILLLTFIVYLICIFLISRWVVQKMKLDYLAKTIIESTEVVEKEEEKVVENIIENPENNENNLPNNSQVYYPNEYWKYTDVKFIDVNLDNLKEKNADTVGWLKVENTNVNYPVTQASDNQYYLKHSFNKLSNSNGWIYGDYRDDFTNFKSNTIIYGHNLTNRSMFGSLVWTLKPSWYNNKENLNIKLSTPKTNTVWQIFSIYLTPIESYYLRTIFASETDYKTFLDTIKSRSINNFNTELTIDDKILTLSTCDDSGTKRLVIHAKMIKIEYK